MSYATVNHYCPFQFLYSIRLWEKSVRRYRYTPFSLTLIFKRQLIGCDRDAFRSTFLLLGGLYVDGTQKMGV